MYALIETSVYTAEAHSTTIRLPAKQITDTEGVIR